MASNGSAHDVSMAINDDTIVIGAPVRGTTSSGVRNGSVCVHTFLTYPLDRTDNLDRQQLVNDQWSTYSILYSL